MKKKDSLERITLREKKPDITIDIIKTIGYFTGGIVLGAVSEPIACCFCPYLFHYVQEKHYPALCILFPSTMIGFIEGFAHEKISTGLYSASLMAAGTTIGLALGNYLRMNNI